MTSSSQESNTEDVSYPGESVAMIEYCLKLYSLANRS